MSESGKKGSLPYGWVVHASKKYPDRIYYFNVVTGATTWECPVLDPPRLPDYQVPASKPHTSILHAQSPQGQTQTCTDKAMVSVSSQESENVCARALRTAIVTPVVLRGKKDPANAQCNPSPDVRPSYSVKRSSSEFAKEAQNVIAAGSSSIKKSKISMESCMQSSDTSECSDLDNLNDTEDIEMLDMTADLTKIDDIAAASELTGSSASYYIVVDTNVLISELDRIDEIKDTPIEGCGPPHIFIPWIVIQELDSLKGNLKDDISLGARKAVRYLHTVLKAKHPRFHGQSPQEVKDWAKTYSKCNDDRLLECCMSLAEKMPREKVILLTNDKNLINKGMICDIVCYDWNSMFKVLKPDLLIQTGTKPVVNTEKRKKKKKSSLAKLLVQDPTALSRDAKLSLELKLSEEKSLCKTDIHEAMLRSRQLLKEVLLPFFEIEMQDAYGDTWKLFKIQHTYLKGILDAIDKYWRSVFGLSFSQKDRRHFQLLRGVASRPDGFLVHKEEDCLSILTAIEDLFCKIKRRWAGLEVPIESIQDLRSNCAERFAKQRGMEASLSTMQATHSDPILRCFEHIWATINHLCGMVLDFCQIPHSFSYTQPEAFPPPAEFHRLIVNFYPSLQNLKMCMASTIKSIEGKSNQKVASSKFFSALSEFIPSLQIQAENPDLTHFTRKDLVKYCSDPETKERVQLGYSQLEQFYTKLDQALGVMMSVKKSKTPPTSMSCD